MWLITRSMMNNSWYIVRPEVTKERNDRPALLFRHPVEPGNGQNGWLKESVELQLQNAQRKTSAPTKEFTREEIEKHSTDKDCWIVINNRVYDATSVLSWHPGGMGAIMPHAGRIHMDTTEEYESIHDAYAKDKLEGLTFPNPRMTSNQLLTTSRMHYRSGNQKVRGLYEEGGRGKREAEGIFWGTRSRFEVP